MKKLIASTMTHSKQSLKETLEILKKAGFEKAELCSTADLAPHLDVEGASLASISHVSRLIRDSKIGIHCINIGGDYTISQMKYVYALAEMIDAKIITYSCGYPKDGVSNAERLKYVTEFNSKLADLGEEYGIICSVEAPHKNSLASNTAEVDKYWAMQDPRVKLTFDTAHLTYCGEDMLALAKKYVSRMVHSHLRDAEKGNSLLRYGQGIVDFNEYFNILKNGGYTGYFSMEYPSNSPEDAAQKLDESVKFLSQYDI